MAEADNISQVSERFGCSVHYDRGETWVGKTYLDAPKHVARQKALELAALLSVLSFDPENVTSLNEELQGAFFGHLDDLGHQVRALTELVAK